MKGTGDNRYIPDSITQVALVLSHTTWQVTQQFHLRFDQAFHSIKQIKLTTKWRVATGFEKDLDSDNKRKSIMSKGNRKPRNKKAKKKSL